MVKRELRNKARKIVTTAFSLFSGILIIALLFFLFKNVFPLIKNNGRDSANIIKSIEVMPTNIDDFRKELDRKNIIFSSLSESSDSAAIIGQMKDGPVVYFSKDKDVSWQIGSLQIIVDRLSINNKRPSSVDLRAAHPIVKF